MSLNTKKKVFTRGPTAPILVSDPTILITNNNYKIEIPIRSSPKPTFTWTKNGKQIRATDKRCQSKLEGLVPNFKIILTISNFTNSDNRDYKCTVKNSFGSLVVSPNLLVQEKSIEQQNKNNESVNNYFDEPYVSYNKYKNCAEISILCTVDSKIEPNATWKYVNTILQQPKYDQVCLFQEGNWVFFLEIYNITLDIVGKYTLTATFSDSKQYIKIYELPKEKVEKILKTHAKEYEENQSIEPNKSLDIQIPTIESPTLPILDNSNKFDKSIPRFVQYPENYTLQADQIGFVEAIITGQPFPTVKWFKNRREIFEGPKYHIFLDELLGKIALEIVRPKSSDEGQYSVKIINSQGVDSCEFNVYLQGKDSTLDFRGRLRRLSSSSERTSITTITSEDGAIFKEGSIEPNDKMTDDERRRSNVNPAQAWPSLRKTKVAKKEKDHWIITLKDCEFNESNLVANLSATFCKSTGRLRWYKNRVEIFHGQKYNFISKGAVQMLTINKLHPDDSGNYICSMNDVETRCWLEVKPGKLQYDFYKQLPVKLEVFRTKTTILECHVSHTECPVIWKKDQKRLDNDNKRIKMYIDNIRCILRIQRTAKEDNGVYSCEIEGEIDKITTCYLYVLEPQWRFHKKLPSKIETNEYNEAVLEVEVEDLEAECEWFFDEELLTEETNPQKYRFESQGYKRRMFLLNANPLKDTGKYECRTGVMKSQTNLRVIPALIIVKHLTDCVVCVNDEIHLEFELNHPQKDVVSWFINEHRIRPSERILILSEKSKHSVIVKSATLADGGSYKANVGNLEDTCKVTVNKKPKPLSIELGNIPKSITVKVNEPIEIKVPFKGFPMPSFNWTINGNLIKKEYVELNSEKKFITLKIPQANRKHDTGKFDLTLENSSGSINVSVPVTVLDVPEAPLGPLIVKNTSYDSCYLSWNPPSDNGSSEILHYVIEKMDSKSKKWTVAEQIRGDNKELSCIIKKLTTGYKYDFRVKAVNKIGSSEYLNCDKSVLIEDKCTSPTCVDKPQISDIQCNKVKINWEPPNDDGGEPITEYQIEIKEGQQGKWKETLCISNDNLSAIIPNLKENSKYEFRVRAKNRVGKSQPSESSGIITTIASKSAPFISTKNNKTITLKQGDKLCLNHTFEGVPFPDIIWTLNKKPIQCDKIERIIKNEINSTMVKLFHVEKEDAGEYQLIVRNELGEDENTCIVIVKGPPSPPMGPIVINDTQKNRISFSWNPPADDGDSLVSNYIIERLDEENGKWIKVTDSISGTQYTVRKLQEGHAYQFRVFAENLFGISECLCTTEATVAENPYQPPSPPSKPLLVSKNNKCIEIKWDPPAFDGGASIKGFHVERFNSFANRWKRLTNDAISSTCFKDQKFIAGQDYTYRIIAVNVAGEGNASEESDIITAKPDKEPPIIHVEDLPKIYGKTEIHARAGSNISIDVPISGIPVPVCTWSKNSIQLSDERYQLDNDSLKSNFMILCSKRSDSGAYTISASNEAGTTQDAINIFVEDVPTPCIGPVKITNIDSTSVEISWNVPEDDGGSPITGYRIEKCIEESDIWESVDNNCTSTRKRIYNLENLKNYKFRICAINKFGYSEPIETDLTLIKSPFDPPSAPQNVLITAFDETYISIKWDKPENDGGSVVEGYFIEAREKDGSWHQINQKINRVKSFTYENIKPGNAYEFRVKGVNEVGEGQQSRSTGLQIAEKPITVPVSPLKPFINKISDSSVTLSLRPPNDDGGSPVTEYIVEKRLKYQDDVWVETKRIPSDNLTVVIDDLNKGEEVCFRVKALNMLGSSDPSDETDFTVIETQPEIPKFCNNDLGNKKICVRAGNEFKLDIPYSSYPIPFVMLDRDDNKIIESNKLNAEISNENVQISCNAAERQMTGKYNLKIKNRLGSANANIELIVQDVPFKPKGPLKVALKEGTKCILQWKPPIDDGGSEISSYIVEQRIAGSTDWKPLLTNIKTTRCEVKQFNNNNRYDFRVRAINQLGISSALYSEESVKIKLPYNLPSVVTKLACKNRTLDSIEIEWHGPDNDGGSPITGYMIELKSDKELVWKPINMRPQTFSKILVPDLMEGQKYDFRIAAVNDAGLGAWAETKESIETRMPDESPMLYGFENSIREIQIKKGEPINIRIPFTGSPVPEFNLTKGGQPIVDNNLFNVDVKDGQIILQSDKALDDHGGNYTCCLKNNSGTVFGQMKLLLTGSPGVPEGPLDVSECTPDGCVLKWNPPLEVNGEPVSNYVIEVMDSKTDKWEVLAKSCRSNSYEVYGLIPGHSYNYRVRAENIHGVSDPLETIHSTIADYPFKTASMPQNFDAVGITDSSVALNWSRPANDGGSRITGYRVEMRGGYANEWILVKDLENETSINIDSLLPEKFYDFRVMTKNEAGLSKPAILPQPIKLQKPASCPHRPPCPLVSNITNNTVMLSLHDPLYDGGSPIIGYTIEKREINSSVWEPACVEPVKDDTVVINDLVTNSNYQFRIKAINDVGSSEPSECTSVLKIVNYIKDPIEASFIKRLSNVIVSAGHSIEFNVAYIGNPTPTVKWYKNGNLILPGTRYNVRSTHDKSTLTFNEVFDNEDGTEIRCVVENEVGKSECSCKLNLIKLPCINDYPINQSVQMGDTLLMKVPITSSDSVKCSLWKEGTKIDKFDDKIKIDQIDGTITIAMKECQNDVQGNYTLLVENDAGSVNANFTVKVFDVPSQPQGPLNVSDITKDSCVLTWKKPISDGNKKISHYLVEKLDLTKPDQSWTLIPNLFKNTHARLENLTKDHQFMFRVKAVNVNGEGEALSISDATQLKNQYGIPLQTGRPEIDSITNGNINLTWSASNKSGFPVSAYFVEKKVNDKWSRIDTKFIKNKAVIGNLIDGEKYEFRVIAVNDSGESEPSENSLSTVFKDDTIIIGPKIIEQLKNNSVIENQTVTFTTLVSGQPDPQVKWYKGLTEISDDSKYTITSINQKHSLAIKNANSEDIDEYSIKVKNKGGSKVSKAMLNVSTSPKIKFPIIYENSVLAKQGDIAEIKIPFTSQTKPNIKWTHNGIPINHKNGVDIETTESYTILRIPDVNKEDSGEYKLTIFNDIGSCEADVNLVVYGVPDPSRDICVNNIEDELVTLSWTPPLYDGNDEITNYIIEIRNVEEGNLWKKAGSCRLPRITLDNLLPHNQYQFRVITENVNGKSTPCEATNIITTTDSVSIRKTRNSTPYGLDENNIPIRGLEGYQPTNYDQCVTNVWASDSPPKPATIQTSNIYDSYDIFEEIGRSSFGTSYRAVERNTGKSYVATFKKAQNEVEKKAIIEEIKVMTKLIHPRLLNLHDCFEHNNEFVLITEFMSGDDMYSKFKDRVNSPMSEADVVCYIRQICEALACMHDNNFVHLNLKPQSAVFQTKSSNHLKLVDFNIAKKLAPNEDVKICLDSLEFTAPEVTENNEIGFYTDMWAVGVLTYLLLSGESPFGNDEKPKDNNYNVDFPESLGFDRYSENAKDFIQQLLLRNKSERMTVHDALNHPWLTSQDQGLEQNMLDKDKYRNFGETMGNENLKKNLTIGNVASNSNLIYCRESGSRIEKRRFDNQEAYPRFIRNLSNEYVLEGETAQFRCHIASVSDLNISWLRFGKEIKQSIKYIKKIDGTLCTLEIRKCSKEDQGNYEVMATNSYGERSTERTLFVQSIPQPIQRPSLIRSSPSKHIEYKREEIWEERDFAPVFTYQLRPRVIADGQSVKLMCTYSGKPTPKISWYKDKHLLSLSGNNYRINNLHGVTNIDLYEVHSEDTGMYKCVGENSVGFAETSCQIMVIGSQATKSSRNGSFSEARQSITSRSKTSFGVTSEHLTTSVTYTDNIQEFTSTKQSRTRHIFHKS